MNSLSRQKDVIAKIFRTACKVAESNQSFNNFERKQTYKNLVVLICDEYFTLQMLVLTLLITLATK
jgi:hypothetical protein